MKINVDLIIINAKVYTINPNFDIVESFAVKDGKFISIGTNEKILYNYSSENIVNIHNKTVFPGFIDAHCHFYGLGLSLQDVNLLASKSFEDVLFSLQDFNKQFSPNFIKGRAWNQNEWQNKDFPTKEKLDELFPNTPVAINRIDGHAMLVNSITLALANIDVNTKVFGGSILIKDGVLTGILLDNAMNLVYEIMPKPSKAKQIKALKDAEKICFSYGLTTVSDAGLSREIVELMEELHSNNVLKIRIYAMILATKKSLAYYIDKGIIKTKRLSVAAFKFFIDGALGSKGAYLKENYINTNKKGILVNSEEKLFEIATKIHKTKFQLNVHAIGDKANEIALKTFVNKIGITKERRWRIEHAQIVSEEDFKYFEIILPSVQPTHATSDMYWAEDFLGTERMKGAYAYKRLLAINGKIALGTDFPIEEVNPFLTFYSAVARKNKNNFDDIAFQNKNALTRKEAIKGMTIWAAYSNFEENEKGSIEIGKYADFIILDKDIMSININEVINAKVLECFVAGEKVFSRT